MYFLTKSLADNYFNDNAEIICNRGVCGVYKLDNNVIKKINKKKSEGIYDCFSINNLLQFKNIDVEGFSFAKALVYSGLFDVYATITKYVEGCDISDKPLSYYQIDNVINAVKNIEIAIRKLSDYGVYANDVNYGNIIFDGKNITIIDTTEYYFGEDDASYIYQKNIQKVMDMIFRNIFYKSIAYRNGFASVNTIYKYFWLRGSEFEHFLEIEYLINPVETLIGIRKFMEEDFGVKLDNFVDCYKYIDKKVIEKDFNSRVRIIKK